MASVKLVGIRKIYDEGAHRHVAVHDLDLDIADGEFVVLVGPSGCGKSTTLRMIAGLESISAGELQIGGRVVNQVPAKERDIAMVFQNYALYPHMTAYDNMAFALTLRRLPAAEVNTRVREAAQILGIEPLLVKRRPRQMSGGERQRVALGRAHWCGSRRCSCSTSRSPTSTPSFACRCGGRSPGCIGSSAPPWFMSPTIRWRR